MKTEVSIIIVTYNGIKWIQKCLESANFYPVVVIDNNSLDGTENYIKSNYPEIYRFQQEKNLGFGQANNIGISYALGKGADYVFLLNQDAYLEEGSLEKLIEVSKKNPQFGILSPIHLNGKGDRLDENFSYYLNYRANPDFFSDFILKKPLSEIYEVPFVNAAGWLISRECLETVGGFDPIFFHYGEDENYCQRVKYHGFKIGVVPVAKILHDREDRSSQKIEYGDRKHFEVMEKQLKLKYADINKPLNSELDNLIRKRKNAWLKTTIKLDFKGASFFRNEYLMLEGTRSKVLLSREKNKEKGLNYLKTENS